MALTVCVCESLSYSMVGVEELLRKLPLIMGKNVRGRDEDQQSIT